MLLIPQSDNRQSECVLCAFGAGVWMLLYLAGEANQRGLALGAMHGFKQAVHLPAEFIVDQHMAVVTLI